MTKKKSTLAQVRDLKRLLDKKGVSPSTIAEF